MSDAEPCIGCGCPGQFSILVARMDNDEGVIPSARYYLPNQKVRQTGDHQELWFCHSCMRKVEDNFRAAILYLQSENGLLRHEPE